MSKTNLAIFVSGRGSNAKAIIEKEAQFNYKVALIVLSKSNSPILDFAKEKNIPFLILDKEEFKKSISLIADLNSHKIELIALAGFLWMIPNYLIQAFPDKILNIHPSLLPKYGGKGMYGSKVHKAVISNQEKKSGITIHLVNEKYDEGKILFQEKISISNEDTAETLANKVLEIEHHSYAMVIDKRC